MNGPVMVGDKVQAAFFGLLDAIKEEKGCDPNEAIEVLFSMALGALAAIEPQELGHRAKVRDVLASFWREMKAGQHG